MLIQTIFKEFTKDISDDVDALEENVAVHEFVEWNTMKLWGWKNMIYHLL